eukprot:NODE_8156_length_422_cov_17.458445_g7290_i0.p3 GENE.NODE_8156_length_422_cov_17.458445_g7290_i0~~NODE_8156_length_422_cov_17.458445_g7290_i0.p3  ORF type:complete len:59 (-),score=10.13 NODE_8156_length_422_cov_17.458445_g7290_i0:44-220(-)
MALACFQSPFSFTPAGGRTFLGEISSEKGFFCSEEEEEEEWIFFLLYSLSRSSVNALC